ncbi:MAG: DUF4142 domain-containing protein [Bacteroidota bacterium]
MKRINISLIACMFFCSSIALVSCSKGTKAPDTVENAEERNDSVAPTSEAKDDAEFLVKAAHGSMLEVELAKVAQARALSADVKKYGSVLQEQHSKMLTDIKAVAAKRNVAVPESLNQDGLDKVKKFQEKPTNEFDKDYIKCMVDDHETDIKDFQEEAQSGSNEEVRKLATDALPHLQAHLTEAKKWKEMMK